MAASWTLVPCLVTLRGEFNAVAPGRDKGADGAVGDSSHTSASDHTPDEDSNVLRSRDADSKNEVHALDIDSTGPWPDGRGGDAGGWFDRKIRAIAARERAEYESATLVGRLQNIIWRGQIISRSWGWSEWRPYSGPSKHFDHAHFSARYLSSAESDTRPWGVAEEDDVTKAEFTAWMTEWATSPAGKTALAVAMLTYDPGVDADGKVRPGGVMNPDPEGFKTNPTFGPNYALNRAVVAAGLGYEIRDDVAEVLGAVQALGADPAGVSAEQIAELVAQKLATRLEA